MTRSDEKKGRERAILDFYLKIVGLAGEVRSQERPDFVVRVAGKQIGIEITEYHQPQHEGSAFPRRMIEAEWEKLRGAVVEYRKVTSGLENLSVLLSFARVDVPPRRQHAEFIEAVHAEIRRVQGAIGDRFTTIRIGEKHSAVLRDYLTKIDVRSAGCYLEWDWNHMVASVGTSDGELLGILKSKLDLKCGQGIDELHLVVAGDGPSGATYIGFLSPEWLTSWDELNAAFAKSDYDVVAILNLDESCVWRKAQGWASIKFKGN